MAEGVAECIFNFQDDLFEENVKEAVNIDIPKFVPRNYFPSDEKNDEKTLSEVQNNRKLFQYHADYLYFCGKYTEAMEAYEKLEILFSDNAFMSRNIKESIVWCHIKMDRISEAQTIAEKLHNEATTIEQQMSSRYLQNVLSGNIKDSESLLIQVEKEENKLPDHVQELKSPSHTP